MQRWHSAERGGTRLPCSSPLHKPDWGNFSVVLGLDLLTVTVWGLRYAYKHPRNTTEIWDGIAKMCVLTCFVSLEQLNRIANNAISTKLLESCIWGRNWIKSCFRREHFILGGKSPPPGRGVSLPWRGTVFILSSGSLLHYFSSTESFAGAICTMLTGSRVLLMSYRVGSRNMRWCHLARVAEEGGGNRIVPWNFPGTMIFASCSAVEPKVF